jgi:5S rRNA maturation endonuclease (ribonuclease M5)
MSRTIKREYCPLCQSKDNLCTFKAEDGTLLQQCKTPRCKNHKAFRYDEKDTFLNSDYDEVGGQEGWANYKELPKDVKKQEKEYRGISADVCNLVGIREGQGDDKFIAEYIHHNLDGSTDIKYRWPDKKFSWAQPKGNTTTLFNLHNCNDFTRPLIITEGNEDCASLVELGYQACSLLSASDVENSWKHSKDKIDKFPSIIIAVDNDSAGNDVNKFIQERLQHKQLFKLDLGPFKDANEALITDRDFLEQRIQYPTEILPNGLIPGTQLDFTSLKNQVVRSIPLPWPGLNSGLNGLEYGCLYLFLAGTSTGKSTVLRELAYWYRMNLPELKIANFFLEENETVTPLAYMALELNVPLGTLRRDISQIPDLDYVRARKVVDTDNLIFIGKEFGRNADAIISYIEYLVEVKKFDLIIIDHLSYIIGRTGVSKNGERRDIDEFIYRLQDLVQRLGCIVVAVSHVNESNGKRWDEGEVPNIYSGRGSRALAQVPDGIIGLARAISNEYEKSVLSLYNLKNRWHAQTGKTDELIYIEKTGRLVTK